MKTSTYFKRAVFCDFDGTITSRESFIAMFSVFTPDLLQKLAPEMYAGRLTLREGVRALIESLPSDKFNEILEFTLTIPIRPGFIELLDYLDSKDIPLIIISGGFRKMIETSLGPLIQRIHAVHAIDVDTSGPFIRIASTVEGDTEIMAKTVVMSQYQCGETAAIGDGATDINMALNSSLVFARDSLVKYLSEKGKSFIQWDDFNDIRQHLMNLWK